MPPKRIKFVCTDKIPLPQGQIRNKPGICFKNGLRAGFAAGIQKAQKKQIRMNTIGQDNIRRAAQEITERRERTRMAANDMNIQVRPIQRVAGRRQRFRDFYGLDTRQVIAPAVINIKDYINNKIAERPNVKTNRLDVIATYLMPMVCPNEGGGQAIKRKFNKREMIRVLVDSGRFVSGGESSGYQADRGTACR
jgi:hypothetical protein